MREHWDLEKSWEHCNHNREELAKYKSGACFHCLKTVLYVEITRWIDGGATALCPHCRVDSVLPATDEQPLTTAFLEAMQEMYFGPSPAADSTEGEKHA